MTTDYNVTLELRERSLSPDRADELMDRYEALSPGVGIGEHGQLEVTVTVPAASMRHAVSTVLAMTDGDPLAVHALSTADYDARVEAMDGPRALPRLLSTPEVAERLRISRQAVLKQLENGTLAGVKVGTGWVIPEYAVPSAG